MAIIIAIEGGFAQNYLSEIKRESAKLDVQKADNERDSAKLDVKKAKTKLN